MLGLISKKKAAQAMVPLIKAVQQLSYTQALNQNLGLTIYGYSNQTEQIAAYANISDLYAVCNKVMKTAALIPIYSYKINNQKAYSRYKVEVKKFLKHPTNRSLYQVKQLQDEGLELDEGSELQYFLDHPNKFQSKNEFYQLCYLFVLLTGNRYLFKDVLNAGANVGKPFEMYNLPPDHTFPVASSELPRRVAGYKFTLYHQTNYFEPEQIMHGKYVNPVFDFAGNELIGLSPLAAGAKVLTTIGNETDYSNQALKNAGAGGIINNKEPGDLSMEALGQMKDDVLRELGSAWQGRSNVNANKLGFLAGQWEYIKVAIDPANMQLLEQARHTFKRLCNLYGISDQLFSNDSGAKYDNRDVATKELYTNAALPLVMGLCDDLNKGLIPHFGGNSVINFDITEIPELAEDQAEIIKKFNDAPGFKPNDLRESLGYGRDLGTDGEAFLIKSGYSLLSDVATPDQSLDASLNDYADTFPDSGSGDPTNP